VAARHMAGMQRHQHHPDERFGGQPDMPGHSYPMERTSLGADQPQYSAANGTQENNTAVALFSRSGRGPHGGNSSNQLIGKPESPSTNQMFNAAGSHQLQYPYK
jgi:hypothetical protein